MGTFHQFVFLCFAFFGFAANRLWFRLKHQFPTSSNLPRLVLELPPLRGHGDVCDVRPHPGASLPSQNQELIARLLLILTLLGIFVFTIGLYLTGYLVPFQMPSWLLVLVDSPLLVTVPLGTLSGVLASISLRDLDRTKPTLIYGTATTLIFFTGLLSDDFATLLKRIGAIESQYLSISFISPIPETSPLVIESSASGQSAAAFEGDTSFSTGVNSLYRLAEAFDRDQKFASRCIRRTHNRAATRESVCPPLVRTETAVDSVNQFDPLLFLTSNPFKGFSSLFQCTSWYAAIYPNGLPIQEDLYNLSAPLARSFGSGARFTPEAVTTAPGELTARIKEVIESMPNHSNAALLQRAREGQWWNDPELVFLIITNMPELKDFEAKEVIGHYGEEILKLIELRDVEKQLRADYLGKVIQELKSEAVRADLTQETTTAGPWACLSLDKERILEAWDNLPIGPHKIIIAAYVIAASGYPEEAALLVSKYLEAFAATQGMRSDQIATQEILRIRLLSVLNVLLQYIGDYELLSKYLFQIVDSHKTLMSQWFPGFGMGEDTAMEEACRDPDLQRYVRSFLSAESRLLYFVGKYGMESLGRNSELLVHLHETAQHLFGYASSPLLTTVFNLSTGQVVGCFERNGRIEEEAFRVFRRDALLAFTYANIALGAHYLAGEQISGADMDQYLRASKLALLEARDITKQVLAEGELEAAEHDELDPLRRERLTSAERRNEHEIQSLLTKLGSF